METANQKGMKKGANVGAGTEEPTKPLREKGTSNRVIAMSHPLRANILRLLVERGVMSPAAIAREMREELSNVAYHVRQLEKLGCAELVETRPVRGALEHFYRAIERHLLDKDEWEQLDPIIGEDLVCGFMQSILDDFVASRKAEIVGSDSSFHITRTPMRLDKQGLSEGLELFEKWRLEMAEVELRSAERRAQTNEPGLPVSSSLLLFKMPMDDSNSPR